jgi:hypothetical protein
MAVQDDPVQFLFGNTGVLYHGCPHHRAAVHGFIFNQAIHLRPPLIMGPPDTGSSTRFPPDSLGPSDRAPAGFIGSRGVHLGQ